VDFSTAGFLPVLIISTTIAVGAFIKGVTGLGLPIFAIPALAMFVPVENAVVIMALPSLLANTWLIVVHREHLPTLRKYRVFLVLGFIGALLGTWFLANVNDSLLRIFLASSLGLYLIQHYAGWSTSNDYSGKAAVAGTLGLAAGTLQGTTGISAPIIAPYYHARGLTLSAYAFAVSCTFALLSVAQLSVMTTEKLFTPTLLGYSILAGVTTLMFVPVGVRVGRTLRQATFDRMLPLVFVLIESKLIYDIIASYS
jgi:uncharacterized membrane protein YfcA